MEIHMVCRDGYHRVKERSLRHGFHSEVLPTLSILALGHDAGWSLWFCFLILKMKALGWLSASAD